MQSEKRSEVLLKMRLHFWLVAYFSLFYCSRVRFPNENCFLLIMVFFFVCFFSEKLTWTLSDKKVGSVMCFLLQVATGTDRSSYQLGRILSVKILTISAYLSNSVSVTMSGILAKNKTTSRTF